MVKAETLPANRLHLGDLDQTKPKVQLANISADIARCVWLFNCAGPTDLDEREADAEEARDPSLFRARHWVKNSYIPEEYPPHMANNEQPHETLMFAAVRYHQKFVQISRKDYEGCPDFGEIYVTTERGSSIVDKGPSKDVSNLGADIRKKRIQKRAPSEHSDGSDLGGESASSSASAKGEPSESVAGMEQRTDPPNQPAKTRSGSKDQKTSSKRSKSKVPARRFFIQKGLLYYRDPNGHETVSRTFLRQLTHN